MEEMVRRKFTWCDAEPRGNRLFARILTLGSEGLRKAIEPIKLVLHCGYSILSGRWLPFEVLGILARTCAEVAE